LATACSTRGADTLPTAAPSTTAPPTTAAPTTTTLAPTTTSSTPPTTAPPPPSSAPAVAAVQRVPIAPPVEDGSSEPLVPIGTIEIPKIGLAVQMFEGIRQSTLDHGPGHWPGTAMPGEAGNAVVAAHRVSHHADFRHIDELVPDDDVIMTTSAGTFDYKVVSTEVVQPDALWIVDQTSDATGTLFACHPPGSTRQRIVVHLRLAA